jgi:CelD/BcsL family acetyltransferase involved in cellulose biosynthesis
MSAPIHADQLHAPASTPVRHRPRAHHVVITRATLVPAVLSALDSISIPAWDALAARAIEPNACYLPPWALAVAGHARGRGGALALAAFDRSAPDRLTGLMPVRWARHALSLPGPLLVSWNAYASYSVPLLDRDRAVDAAGAMIDAASAAGARAILLQTIATGGPAYAAIHTALEQRGLTAEILCWFRRAGLDARQAADTVLHDALSAKKLKELRRQRHRLEDKGAVSFEVTSTPDGIGSALERFLCLEAGGWKGERGTAMIQHPGEAAFIREAALALSARGQFEVVRLVRNGDTLAAGLILRYGGRAFFFKIAIDETEARTSPGVQLTLELTRHFCADPAVAFADSTADSENPMIDPIWRERIDMTDVFVPLAPRDPYAAAIRALLKARYRAVDAVRAVRRIREKLS